MINSKEDIRLGQVIVHILDSTVGMPVLSDRVLEYGSEIPQADLLIAEYEVDRHRYLALLKMNYKASYTHLTNFS